MASALVFSFFDKNYDLQCPSYPSINEKKQPEIRLLLQFIIVQVYFLLV